MSAPELVNIDDTIIHSDIFEEKFVCDLSACKGACCVEGEGGAPLNEEELLILQDIYEEVKPYLTEAGKKIIKKHGHYLQNIDGSFETPLVKGRECAYVTFDPDGTAKCGIEKAYLDGKINFKKPISCALYPIRVREDRVFLRLKYDRWNICKPACKNGSKLNVRVFEFLKTPLVERFGQEWYNTLEDIYKTYYKDEEL